MKNYRNRVWDEIEGLDAFSIEAVPRELNTKADSLAVFASLLLPHLEFKDKKYQIEVVYRALIPDNIDFWQVFENEKSLQLFLENDRVSSKSHPDEESREDPSQKDKEK